MRGFNFSDLTVRWFASYLRGWTQAVVDSSGAHSTLLPTTTDVPQGSVLGLTLFSIFINDLPSVLTCSKHMLFADHLQVYRSFRSQDFDREIARFNLDLCAVADWATRDGLTLNPSKTQVIILGSGGLTRRLDLETITKIHLNGTSLPYSSEVRCLGIRLQSNLNWNRQVNQVIGRVHAVLRTLRPIRRALNVQTRKPLIYNL
ncbi:hypothetical protein TKK_0000264 [Trichogramma kaykai]